MQLNALPFAIHGQAHPAGLLGMEGEGRHLAVGGPI